MSRLRFQKPHITNTFCLFIPELWRTGNPIPGYGLWFLVPGLVGCASLVVGPWLWVVGHQLWRQLTILPWLVGWVGGLGGSHCGGSGAAED